MEIIFVLLVLLWTWLVPLPIEPVLPDFTAPKAETRLDRHILGTIRKDGWYPVHVAPRGQEAEFSYSVGLYANYGQPEVVVVGMPPAVAQQFLDNLAARVRQADPPFALYQGYEGIAEDSRIAFVPVAQRHVPGHFDYGGWFYRSVGVDVPFVQMVWPDASGRFPWERGYDPVYAAVQPLLNK